MKLRSKSALRPSVVLIGESIKLDGIIITANSIPMKSDGMYYPYYKICYYLKLKDGVDLDALALANGGEFDLVNTAVWDGHEDSFTYKTVYDYIDKNS